MGMGLRLRQRREELGLSRSELAGRLGVSVSAIGNYETGQNAVREDLLPRLLEALKVDANYLYQDYFTGGLVCSAGEERLVRRYRELGAAGRRAVDAVVDTLGAYQQEIQSRPEERGVREIPLYRCPAAAGFAAPVFGEDYDLIPVEGEVPPGADFAVRIQGDSMEPWLKDGGVAYVNRDPLENGDVGIFCVDGEMLCKQYVRDPLGMVYLLSLNRRRAEADVCLDRGGGRTLVCFGRVILPRRIPIAGK